MGIFEIILMSVFCIFVAAMGIIAILLVVIAIYSVVRFIKENR